MTDKQIISTSHSTFSQLENKALSNEEKVTSTIRFIIFQLRERSVHGKRDFTQYHNHGSFYIFQLKTRFAHDNKKYLMKSQRRPSFHILQIKNEVLPLI